MSMPAALYYTAEMVRALPDDGKRHETVHGELLVSPAPRLAHQVVLQRLALALGKYLESDGIAGLFCVAADLSWGPDILVQPDLFVADPHELQGADSWSDIQTLHLVVEILSPASIRVDRYTKRHLYQKHGVATYWVVDIDHGQVEVWTPEALFPVVARESLAWKHPAATTEFTVNLLELFPATS